jgi:hypothetical protein
MLRSMISVIKRVKLELTYIVLYIRFNTTSNRHIRVANFLITNEPNTKLSPTHITHMVDRPTLKDMCWGKNQTRSHVVTKSSWRFGP